MGVTAKTTGPTANRKPAAAIHRLQNPLVQLARRYPCPHPECMHAVPANSLGEFPAGAYLSTGWCVSQPSKSQPPPGSDERWVGGWGSEPARSAVRISRGCSPRSTPAAARVGGETRRPASGLIVPILPVLTRQGPLNGLCVRWAATAVVGMPAEI